MTDVWQHGAYQLFRTLPVQVTVEPDTRLGTDHVVGYRVIAIGDSSVPNAETLKLAAEALRSGFSVAVAAENEKVAQIAVAFIRQEAAR